MYHLTRFIPAELVETDAHGECFTTSLKVAAFFGKKHQHVLRDINNLLTEIALVVEQEGLPKSGVVDVQNTVEGLSKFGQSSAPNHSAAEITDRPNFRPTSYQNEQGKMQPMYRLNRNSFMLLAMGWSGQKALRCKLQFLEAFDAMEARLHARESHEAQAFYQLREPWRLVVDGTLQGKSRAEIAEAAGYASPESVSGARRRLRDLGVLPQGGQA